MAEHNLLILPNQSLKEFNDHIDKLTPGKLDPKRNRSIYGHQVTPHKETKVERPAFSGWGLPTSFCPDCGLTDITPQRAPDGRLRINPGMWELEESRPDLHLRKGDMVTYWVCHKCMHSALWQAEFMEGGYGLDGEDWESARHARMKKAMTTYIRSKILRGERPVHIRPDGSRDEQRD